VQSISHVLSSGAVTVEPSLEHRLFEVRSDTDCSFPQSEYEQLASVGNGVGDVVGAYVGASAAESAVDDAESGVLEAATSSVRAVGAVDAAGVDAGVGTSVGNGVVAVVGAYEGASVAEIGAGWKIASGSTFCQLPPSSNRTPLVLKVARDQPSTCRMEPVTMPTCSAPS